MVSFQVDQSVDLRYHHHHMLMLTDEKAEEHGARDQVRKAAAATHRFRQG